MKTKLKLHLLLPLCFTFASVYGENSIKNDSLVGSEINNEKILVEQNDDTNKDVSTLSEPLLDSTEDTEVTDDASGVNSEMYHRYAAGYDRYASGVRKMDMFGDKLEKQYEKSPGLVKEHFKDIFVSIKDVAINGIVACVFIVPDALKISLDFIYQCLVYGKNNLLSLVRTDDANTIESFHFNITEQDKKDYLSTIYSINRTVKSVGATIKHTYLTIANLLNVPLCYIGSKVILYITRHICGAKPPKGGYLHEEQPSILGKVKDGAISVWNKFSATTQQEGVQNGNNLEEEEQPSIWNKVKDGASSIWNKVKDGAISVWNKFSATTQQEGGTNEDNLAEKQVEPEEDLAEKKQEEEQENFQSPKSPDSESEEEEESHEGAGGNQQSASLWTKFLSFLHI